MKKIFMISGLLLAICGVANAADTARNMISGFPVQPNVSGIERSTDANASQFLFLKSGDTSAFECGKSPFLASALTQITMPANHYFKSNLILKEQNYECSLTFGMPTWKEIDGADTVATPNPTPVEPNVCEERVVFNMTATAKNTSRFIFKDNMAFSSNTAWDCGNSACIGKNVKMDKGHLYLGASQLYAGEYTCGANGLWDPKKSESDDEKKINPGDEIPVAKSCAAAKVEGYSVAKDGGRFIFTNESNWNNKIGWDAKACTKSGFTDIQVGKNNTPYYYNAIKQNGVATAGMAHQYRSNGSVWNKLNGEYPIWGSEPIKTDPGSGENPGGDVEINNGNITIINNYMTTLGGFIGKKSDWVNETGGFNTTRLLSDSIAGVVLGTTGALITGSVVKKNQVKTGFEDVGCAVGGQPVAGYADEFVVGMTF